MKLVLTGGSGLIGGAVLRKLAGQAVSVRALVSHGTSADIVEASFAGAEVLPLTGDVDEFFNGCDVFLHAGWSTVPSTAEEDPIGDLHANVEGSLRLITAAARARVSRIVFLSSGGTVYGQPVRSPITEDHRTVPVGSYGAAKLCVEKYLKVIAHASGMEHIVLRPGNVYGRSAAHQRPQGVVEHWLACALRKQPLVAWNDLAMVRDYLYIDDVVDAIIASFTARTSSMVFNLGTGVGTSLEQLAHLINEVTGQENEVVRRGVGVSLITTNVLDVSRARAELGYEPRVQLKDGLAATWRKLQAATRS